MTATHDLPSHFETFAATAPDEPGVAEALSTLVAALAGPARRASEPSAWTSRFDATLARHAGAESVTAPLVGAIAAIADDLTWLIPYLDHDEPDLAHLHHHYRYAALAGPYASARHQCDAAALFVTVQNAAVDYTQHVHKAPELYGVVGGHGDWQVGDGPHVRKHPGDWIWHPTGARHAMRTNDEPMTAVAIWTADLDAQPVIVRQ